jgi:hypothetical protein
LNILLLQVVEQAQQEHLLALVLAAVALVDIEQQQV